MSGKNECDSRLIQIDWNANGSVLKQRFVRYVLCLDLNTCFHWRVADMKHNKIIVTAILIIAII